MIQRYRARISGPLLDRIDMHVEVPAVLVRRLQEAPTGTTTAEAVERVLSARQRQTERPGGRVNADLTPPEIATHCTLDNSGQGLLEAAFDRLVARTITDLQGDENLRTEHLAEAIQYRTLDRRVTD